MSIELFVRARTRLPQGWHIFPSYRISKKSARKSLYVVMFEWSADFCTRARLPQMWHILPGNEWMNNWRWHISAWNEWMSEWRGHIFPEDTYLTLLHEDDTSSLEMKESVNEDATSFQRTHLRRYYMKMTLLHEHDTSFTSFLEMTSFHEMRWHIFPWKDFLQNQLYNGITCHTSFLEMRWHIFSWNSFL